MSWLCYFNPVCLYDEIITTRPTQNPWMPLVVTRGDTGSAGACDRG